MARIANIKQRMGKWLNVLLRPDDKKYINHDITTKNTYKMAYLKQKNNILETKFDRHYIT